MKLDDKFLYRVNTYMDQGYILGTRHPDGLMVLTYSTSCTFDRKWDDVTQLCRGLVIDQDGTIVAHPFPKFYNVGERPETKEDVLPWHLPFEVFDKLDGWLGVLYREKSGRHRVSTRGSFFSEGAMWANAYLDSGRYNMDAIPKNITLIFEIISPVTKIIVKYRPEFYGLHVIGAWDYTTGDECPWEYTTAIARSCGFPIVTRRQFNQTDIEEFLRQTAGTAAEGFVVRFANGLRVKFKGKDYNRLAEIHRNMTPLNIWAVIRNGEPPKNYRDSWPGEFLHIYDTAVAHFKEEWEKHYQRAALSLVEIMRDLCPEYGICMKNGRLTNIPCEVPTDVRRNLGIRGKSLYPQDINLMFNLLNGKLQGVDRTIHERIRPKNNKLVKT